MPRVLLVSRSRDEECDGEPPRTGKAFSDESAELQGLQAGHMVSYLLMRPVGIVGSSLSASTLWNQVSMVYSMPWR